MTGGVGFGVFSVDGDEPRVGFRVGHGILDLAAHGLGAVFDAPSLNPFLALGRASWEDTVARIVELVGAGANFVPLEDAELRLPFEVADYVDFYSSLEHASNLGRLFRPDSEPLLPNWRRLPVGYHGRAGTVVVEWNPGRPPVGSDEGAGRGRAVVRPEQAARHRARARLRGRCRKPARRARADLRVPRPRLRRGARQRLERAGHPGLGVPAARAVPRKVLRDVDRRLGDAAGSPRGPLRRVRQRRNRLRSSTSSRQGTGRSTSSWRSSSAAP